MNKYLRWEKDTVIFVVARILEPIKGVPQFIIKGSKRFADGAAAQVFHTYFKSYCELAANVDGADAVCYGQQLDAQAQT